MVDCLKNHWKTIGNNGLAGTSSINGNGYPRNHWFLAIVLNFLFSFLAKAKFKQALTNMLIKYFRIANLKRNMGIPIHTCQLCELAVKYFRVMLCLTFKFWIYLQFVMKLILSQNTNFSSFETIVNHCTMQL